MEESPFHNKAVLCCAYNVASGVVFTGSEDESIKVCACSGYPVHCAQRNAVCRRSGM